MDAHPRAASDRSMERHSVAMTMTANDAPGSSMRLSRRSSR